MATTEKAQAALIADLLQEIARPESYSWESVSRLGALLPPGAAEVDADVIVQGLQEYVTRLHCAEIEARKNFRALQINRESSGSFPEGVASLSAFCPHAEETLT